MGDVIHARKRPDGTFVYRIWNTTCDSYETEDLDEHETLLQLKYRASYDATQLYERLVKESTERVARAQQRGTSSHVDTPVALDAPWETESCEFCGGFHHVFLLSERAPSGAPDRLDRCAECGEPRGAKAHQPPCLDAES